MAGYDGAGSLFALGLRVTKLGADGAPLVGATSSYVTSSLVSIGMGHTYSEPDAIELRNGSGQTCVYYAPSPTLLGGTIEDFRACTPDPVLLQFCYGGDIITSNGVNEVQTVTITGSPTGGTFTLTFSGQTTGPIAYNAAASAVTTALNALSNINPGDVSTSGTGPYTVTFAGQYANANLPQMTASGASLTGGTSPTVNVATTTQGAAGTNVIGYQAPAVNVDPNPFGVAVEAWSNAVRDNSFDGTLPYFHWVMPRCKLRPSEALTLSAEDAATPIMEGTTEQNPGFGDGPSGDIAFPTSRIYQFSRVATLPDLTTGYVEVSA